MLIISLEYTSGHINHIVHALLNVCCIHTTFILQRTRIQNVQVFDKPRHFTDEKHVNHLPWLHTSHTNQITHNLFNVCSNHTMFKLQRPRIQHTQLAVYTSDTPVTLKHGQGHQPKNDNVDPKQG